MDFLGFDLFSHLPVIACRGTLVTSGHEALLHLGPLYSKILVGMYAQWTSVSIRKASLFVQNISINIYCNFDV